MQRSIIPSSVLAILVLAMVTPLRSLSAEAGPVIIVGVTIDIVDSRTNENALRRWINVAQGAEFDSLEAARDAVDRDVQELINLRAFLSVEGELKPAGGGMSRYEVEYRIVDANTFVPIPLVLYDSNSGGFQLLYIQIWDNMFGSLVNWFSIANLTLRGNAAGDVETGPWLFAPRVSNIKGGNLIFGVGFDQERVESSRYLGATLISHYRFDRSAVKVDMEVRFGPRRRLYYTVEPEMELRYGYTDLVGMGGFSQSPFSIQLTQSFFYDSVDAFHNSRRGIRTGASSTVRLAQTDGGWKPVVDLSGEFAVFLAFGERGWLSYYPRIRVFTVFNDVYEKLGKPVRGIPDVTMDGNFALYLNQTLGISLWRWRGVWNLQLHPWLDLAIAAGGTRPFRGLGDMRRSVGADVLLFIEKVPNLVFRFSWGVDLDTDVQWGEKTKTEFIVRYSYSY